MKAVFKAWKSLLPAAMFAAAALLYPGNILAEPNQKTLVRAVADLTELRDQIADNRAMILKSGWNGNAYVDDKLVFQDVEKSLADFKPWLDAVPPGDMLKAERLAQTVSRIPKAEEVYRASIERCRNSSAQSLLGLISITELGGVIMHKTDALVLGYKPVYLSADPEVLKKLGKFGFKPDPNVGFMRDLPENHKAASVELLELPVGSAGREESEAEKEPVEPRPVAWGPPPVEPSSDPEVLRLAYEAYKAYQSLYYLQMPASYDVQLAMAEFTTMPAHLWYDPQHLEKTLEPIRRLPGLTERELKTINDLPKFFQETEEILKSAGEALAQKKQAQADLEELVESALADIDALRACYLRRLAEKGE